MIQQVLKLSEQKVMSKLVGTSANISMLQFLTAPWWILVIFSSLFWFSWATTSPTYTSRSTVAAPNSWQSQLLTSLAGEHSCTFES